MKFSIADLVVEKAEIEDHNPIINKVVIILDGALIVDHYGSLCNGQVHIDACDDLEPGSRGWRLALRRFQDGELFTINEAIHEVSRLQSAKHKLDEEFNTVHAQIKVKLGQAASLVKEAGNLAAAYNKEFYDLKSECMPLYQALVEGGWSHSHMSC